MATSAGRPALVAINEGPLRQLLASAAAGAWPHAAVLRQQLNTPFHYRKGGYEQATGPAAAALPPGQAVLLNLGARQVLTDKLVFDAIALALNKVDYAGAPAGVLRNKAALEQPRVQKRLHQLLSQHVRQGGTHVTMHQLLGLLARLLTGGTGADTAGQRDYFEVAFDQLPDSALATALAELDPAQLAHAHLDTHQLWDEPGRVGTWLPGRAPGDGSTGPNGPAYASPCSLAQGDLPQAQAEFRRLKRQFYFENAAGEQLVQALPPDRADFAALLAAARDAPEKARRQVLDALARFVQQPSGGQQPATGPTLSDSDLYLWRGLRYDADRLPTVLVAGPPVSAQELVVELPDLADLQRPLLAYEPDHLRLVRRQDPTGPALRIDLDLWRALSRVNRGLPAERRSEQASRRIGRFLAGLATQLAPAMPEAQPQSGGLLWVHDVRRSLARAVLLEENSAAPNKVKYVIKP